MNLMYWIAIGLAAAAVVLATWAGAGLKRWKPVAVWAAVVGAFFADPIESILFALEHRWFKKRRVKDGSDRESPR